MKVYGILVMSSLDVMVSPKTVNINEAFIDLASAQLAVKQKLSKHSTKENEYKFIDFDRDLIYYIKEIDVADERILTVGDLHKLYEKEDPTYYYAVPCSYLHTADHCQAVMNRGTVHYHGFKVTSKEKFLTYKVCDHKCVLVDGKWYVYAVVSGR